MAFDFLVVPMPQTGSSKIVFASTRDGSMQIYSMNTDGSGQTRLTYSGANDDSPRWSPNGARILFQSDRDNPSTGYMDIYVMNADGSGITRLTSDANDDSVGTWSPDGSKIAFQSARNGVNYQVYVMNADGSGQVNISNNGANETQPSWSPDGTKIAFASDRDQTGFSSIYVMSANGSNQTRLTFSGTGVRDEQPAWSPDGTKVAFTSTRDSIVVTWQETDDDGGIVTKSELHVNKEIYVMSSDGTNQIRLTNDLGNDDSPNWSPDGTKIIFRSDRERDCCDPTAQVWMMNPDGSGQANISNSGNADYTASWSVNAGNQLPVANTGGTYNGAAALAVNFDGRGSFDPDGTIASYAWNFGDGGAGAGPASIHAYATAGTYTVTLTVTDNLGAQGSATTTATITNSSDGQSTTNDGSSVSPDATARPVTINFDGLATGTIVTNQYELASFSPYGFSAGGGGPFGHNIWTINDCGVNGSCPNGIESADGYWPDWDVYVDFKIPVSGLTFRILNQAGTFLTHADIDVYVNHSFYQRVRFSGNGQPSVPTVVNLSSIPHITGIAIRNVSNTLDIDLAGYYPRPLIYDDFTFTPDLSVDITNPRVSGGLDQTTQNALVGAKVSLQSTASPIGGTYSWSFTGSPIRLLAAPKVLLRLRFARAILAQPTPERLLRS